MVKRLPDNIRRGLTMEWMGGFFRNPRMYTDGVIEKGAIGEADRAVVEAAAGTHVHDDRMRNLVFGPSSESDDSAIRDFVASDTSSATDEIAHAIVVEHACRCRFNDCAICLADRTLLDSRHRCTCAELRKNPPIHSIVSPRRMLSGRRFTIPKSSITSAPLGVQSPFDACGSA